MSKHSIENIRRNRPGDASLPREVSSRLQPGRPWVAALRACAGGRPRAVSAGEDQLASGRRRGDHGRW